MGVGCLIPYYKNKERGVFKAGGCFLRALPHSPIGNRSGDLHLGDGTPGRLSSDGRGFSARVVGRLAARLTELSPLKLWFLAQGSELRRVPFPARIPPHHPASGGWRPGPGSEQRRRGARGAGRAAGAGARPSGRRRRRRRARARIPQKRPEPAGRRHPRLRPRPSPSKVTLD